MGKTVHPHSGKDGFTIVELLIVIIVIGILAALILVAYGNVTNQAKVTSLVTDLNQANKQLNIDKERGGGSSYPSSLSFANNGNGLSPTAGNTSTYYTNASQSTYCLNETNGTVSYFVASSSQAPAVGTCAGSGYGTVGWWTLNGSANDVSGGGLNGTINGPTSTTGVSGSANGAYSFAGTNDMITLPSNAALNSSVFTYSAWVKPTSWANQLTILGGSCSSGPQFRIENTAKQSQLLKQSIASIGFSTATLPLNAWSQVAVSYDTSGVYTFYTNGQPSGTGTNLQTFSFCNMQIGRNNNTGEGFIGSIDDVRIYNRILNANDIQSIYAMGAQ